MLISELTQVAVADRKYDNAMSMIMTYRDDLEIEEVMEYMIAGYFSDNQIQYQNNNIGEN